MPRIRRLLAALTGVLVLQLSLGTELACAGDVGMVGAPAPAAARAANMVGMAHDEGGGEPQGCSRAGHGADCSGQGTTMPCASGGTCVTLATLVSALELPVAASVVPAPPMPPRALHSIAAASPDLPPPRA